MLNKKVIWLIGCVSGVALVILTGLLYWQWRSTDEVNVVMTTDQTTYTLDETGSVLIEITVTNNGRRPVYYLDPCAGDGLDITPVSFWNISAAQALTCFALPTVTVIPEGASATFTRKMYEAGRYEIQLTVATAIKDINTLDTSTVQQLTPVQFTVE